ncbi:MAG TPA: alpha/beta fold hydrolase [Polyangiaceae bacterium]|jgi:carboxylesterase
MSPKPELGALRGATPLPISLAGRSPAVLALHGFGGTPFEVQLVTNAAQSLGLAASAPLLAGHGSHARDLARTRFSDWLASAREALAALPSGPVIACGLSLGSLLAIRLACAEPERISALVLLANATRLSAPFPAWLLAAGGFLRIPDFLMPKRMSDIADGVARSSHVSYSADPVHAAIDLHRGAVATRALLKQVKCPTLIVHGAHDRVCPVSNAWRVAEALGTRDVRVLILPRSHHILTRDLDRDALSAELTAFFSRFSG